MIIDQDMRLCVTDCLSWLLTLFLQCVFCPRAPAVGWIGPQMQVWPFPGPLVLADRWKLCQSCEWRWGPESQDTSCCRAFSYGVKCLQLAHTDKLFRIVNNSVYSMCLWNICIWLVNRWDIMWDVCVKWPLSHAKHLLQRDVFLLLLSFKYWIHFL